MGLPRQADSCHRETGLFSVLKGKWGQWSRPAQLKRAFPRASVTAQWKHSKHVLMTTDNCRVLCSFERLGLVE